MVFAGFMQLIALRTRSAAATQVTYVMEALRALIIEGFDWGQILPGFAVVAVLGAAVIALNVRLIARCD